MNTEELKDRIYSMEQWQLDALRYANAWMDSDDYYPEPSAWQRELYAKAAVLEQKILCARRILIRREQGIKWFEENRWGEMVTKKDIMRYYLL